MAVTDNTQIYIIGGGIASLATAVFCIRDGHIPGKNVHIFEVMNFMGGALDAFGSPDKYYVCRGARLFNEKAYNCFLDLLSTIPSLTDPKKTVRDEIFEFNEKTKLNAKARLVDKDRKIIDVTTLGLDWQDMKDLFFTVIIASEDSLDNRRIDECFAPSFFKTNFWYLFASMFGFKPWDSAVEFKRYVPRFIHEAHKIRTLTDAGWNTPYNNYDSVVRPIMKWLEQQGVNFEMEIKVTDLDFKPSKTEKTVERIHCLRNGKKKEIVVNPGDYVFVTIGSMTADSRAGSMTQPPHLERGKLDGSWTLWENIVKKQPDLGNPSVFADHIDETKWVTFAVTSKDPTFFRLYEQFTGNKPGEGHLVTFIDSNWFMSVHVPFQPFFINQPEHIGFWGGYGLFPDRKGNYVNKTMPECTGEELLSEVCYHFGFIEEMPHILKTSICIPNMLPYATSQFLVRKKGDRPPVVPLGSTNLAFLGQFCEIPDDIIFTVEYSVRSAQTGVYSLLNLDKKVPPIYKGLYDKDVWSRALDTLLGRFF